MAHFQRNVNRFKFDHIFCVDEIGLNFDVTPRRTLNPRNCKKPCENGQQKPPPFIVSEHETKGEGATSVIVLIGTGDVTLRMIIPHHKKKSHEKQVNAVKCPVEEQNMPCDCSERDVHGIHEIHWSNFVTLMVESLPKHSAVIIDQLSVHVNIDTRTRLAQQKITPLYMYPKTAFQCSPLDNGYFSVFRSTLTSILSSMGKLNNELMRDGIDEALRGCSCHQKAFFEKCGYNGQLHRVDYSPPVPALTVLPFGAPPDNAKLSRVQDENDFGKVIIAGRPPGKKPAPKRKIKSVSVQYNSEPPLQTTPKVKSRQRFDVALTVALEDFYRNDHHDNIQEKNEFIKNHQISMKQLNDWLKRRKSK